MSTNQDEIIFQSFAKKNLDFCEKFFIEKMATDFPLHIDKIIEYFQSILQEGQLTFHEKQVINEINKRLTLNRKEMGDEFKSLLKANMQKQFKNKTLDDGLLSFHSVGFESEDDREEVKMVDLINTNLKKVLGEDLKRILEATNYLMMDNKDLYSAKMLSYTLQNTLKKYFTNRKAINFTLHAFSINWPKHLLTYYKKMIEHLEANEVFKKLEQGATIYSDQRNSANLVPDLNSFLNDAKTSNKTKENKEDAPISVATNPNSVKVENFDDFFSSQDQDLILTTPNKNIPIPNTATPTVPIKKEEPIESAQFFDTKALEKEIAEKEALRKKQAELKNHPHETTAQFVNPEKEIALSIQSLALDNLSFIKDSIYSLNISQVLGTKPINKEEQTNSKIIYYDNFNHPLKDLQSKFIKITPDFFEKSNLKQKNVIFEMLKNKAFQSHMSSYDYFVFNLLSKTYKRIFANDSISNAQKTVLFNTQLFVLDYVLHNKVFFSDKNNPAKIFLSYIFNTETLFKPKLSEKICEIISEISVPAQINNEFFISKLPPIKAEINSQIENQKSNIANNIKQMEEDEQHDYYYNNILSHVAPVAAKTNYLPVSYFIEKVWIIHYIKKMNLKMDLAIFEDQNFTKFLSLHDKVYWHQSFLFFENLMNIANNKNNSVTNINKMKELLNQVNSDLAKLTIEFDVSEKFTKPLFAFLKYRTDILSKTSNIVTLQKELDKIKPKELEYQTEIDNFAANVVGLRKANIDIEKNNFKLNEFLQINNWYSLTNKVFKLVYISPKENHFILINYQTNTIHDYTKAKIWYLIKNKALKNVTEEYNAFNFSKILLESNEELSKNGSI